MSEIHFPKDFSKNFEELSILYSQVKELILITENLTGKYLLAPINEVRNSYDHLFRCVGKVDEDYKSEFESSTRHLKRAGYDACEILSTFLLKDIKLSLTKFSPSVIAACYKNYYSEIKPKINKIELEYLTDARKKKNHHFPETEMKKEKKKEGEKDGEPTKEDSFEKFENLTQDLIQIRDEIDKLTPSFVEYANSRKKRRRRNLIVAIILMILGVVLGKVLPDKKSGDKNHLETEAIDTTSLPR